ncbi:MAG: transpeptidase family protein [Deltaproteobacteria bacterium]|nr:transpeptidase family protein [Deltaproteobacteria bacterium]
MRAGERSDRSLRLRLLVVGGILALGFGIVIVRSLHLHLMPQGNLQWIAEKQYNAVIPMAQRRGKIVDARGRELAVSVPVKSVFADPTVILDAAAALGAIESILPLGKERSRIERRMTSHGKFAWIKRGLAPGVADKIEALNIPGIHFIEESRRVYPNGELASQLLGAVGYDAEPLAGLELTYDRYLRTTARMMTYRRDARGRIYFSPVGFDAQQNVGTVQLTIDKIIQYVTEQAVQRSAEETEAASVMAVVVEVSTGRILAMASRPTFDPNVYYKYPQSSWRNRIVTDMYEPGSIFKVLVASAAIDGHIPPSDTFDCEHGSIRIGNAVLRDHGASYGLLSMPEIIKVSSNIGAYKIARRLGKDAVAQALGRFGIGAKSTIDFPGETAGMFRADGAWQPVEFATIAFGQGVAVTPLQMAMAFAAIANGGRLMRPYVVERIVDHEGAVVYSAQPTVRQQAIASETAMTVRAMLRGVVEPGGTGTLAASSLYLVAGKTGTAQKARTDGKGYAPGKYFSSFVGLAPFEAPRIAVFVGVDEPRGRYYGGTVAGPVFRSIVEATLQYLEVPTTGAPIILAKDAPSSSPSAPGEGVNESGDERQFHALLDGDVVVPNLRGLSVRHVLRLVHELNVPVTFAGSGVVIAQKPGAGERVGERSPLHVEFAMPQ